MAGQRTKGFQFPGGAFGDFAGNIVRAGQYEGQGMASLLGGFAQGINTRRDRTDRKEREAADEAFRRDQLARSERQAAAAGARADRGLDLQERSLDLRAESLEVEKARFHTASLQKEMEKLQRAMSTREALASNTSTPPEVLAVLDQNIQSMQQGIPGFAMKLKQLPQQAAATAINTPEDPVALGAAIDITKQQIDGLQRIMRAGAAGNAPPDQLREATRTFAVKQTQLHALIARAEAAASQAQRVGVEQERAERAEAAHSLSDAWDGYARSILGVGAEEDLPPEASMRIQEALGRVRSGGDTAEAERLLRASIDKIAESSKPKKSYEDRLREAAEEGTLEGVRGQAKAAVGAKSADERIADAELEGTLEGVKDRAKDATYTKPKTKGPDNIGEKIRGDLKDVLDDARGDEGTEKREKSIAAGLKERLAAYPTKDLQRAIDNQELGPKMASLVAEEIASRDDGEAAKPPEVAAMEERLGRSLSDAEVEYLLKNRK